MIRFDHPFHIVRVTLRTLLMIAMYLTTTLTANVVDAVQWINTTNGFYHDGSNWNGGAVPASPLLADLTGP